MSKDISNKEDLIYLQKEFMNIFKWVSGIVVTIMLAMMGVVSTFLGTNSHKLNTIDKHLDMQNRNLESLEGWTHMVWEQQIVPSDSLSKINSHRLDIQSTYGYNQVAKFDSINKNQDYRIDKLEKVTGLTN